MFELLFYPDFRIVLTMEATVKVTKVDQKKKRMDREAAAATIFLNNNHAKTSVTGLQLLSSPSINQRQCSSILLNYVGNGSDSESYQNRSEEKKQLTGKQPQQHLFLRTNYAKTYVTGL